MDNFYKYEFYHSTLWIENGILFAKYKPNVIVNVDVAIQMVKDRKMVCKGICRPIFIDITDLCAVNEAARTYLASAESCELMSAGAIFTTNAMTKIVGMAFKILDRPQIPVKIFTDKEAALNWLATYLDVSYSASSGQ